MFDVDVNYLRKMLRRRPTNQCAIMLKLNNMKKKNIILKHS